MRTASMRSPSRASFGAGTAATLLALLAVTACRGADLTELIVVVDSDPSAPGQLSSVTVEVKGLSGALRSRQSFPMAPAEGASAGDASRFPFSFAVIPADEEEVSWDVVLEISALPATVLVPRFTRRVVTRFVPGSTLLLPVFLPLECAKVMCPEDQTCSERGCVSEWVDPSTLRRILPGEELEHPIDPRPPGAELCDGIDNDLDGQVDEGHVHQYWPGTGRQDWRYRVHIRNVSLARSSSTVASLSIFGRGTPWDELFIVVSRDTESVVSDASKSVWLWVAEPLRLHNFQPSVGNRLLWLEDRYLFAGRTAASSCGGARSSTCPTYLGAVGEDGQLALWPSEVLRSAPASFGFILAGREVVVTFADGAGRPVRFQGFTKEGARTSLIGTLRGSASGADTVRAQVFGEAIQWLYSGAEGGVWLEATKLDGTHLAGPVRLQDLDGELQAGADAGMYVEQGVLYVPYLSRGSAFVGRFGLDGKRVGPPTRVLRRASFISLEPAGQQLFVLCGSENPPEVYFSRLGLDGTLVQAPTFILPVRSPAMLPIGGTGAMVLGWEAFVERHSRVRLGCPR